MILIIAIIVLCVAYYLLKRNYEYWEKRGVPGPNPTLIVGNLGKSFLLKKSAPEIHTDIYNEYQNSPIVGLYRAATPVLLIRDPELIKEVTIKSFNHFHDNELDINKDHDPLFGRHPVSLRGDEWKVVRTQLTPGFTSGKMKWIYPHLEETGSQLVKFVENTPAALNGQGYEAKELCSRFTLNNVASCAFGLEGKCFEEENSEFTQIANQFLAPGGWMTTLLFIMTIVPSLARVLSIKLTSKQVEEKLTNIVTKTLKYREENSIVRNDFLHILSQLKKTCKDYEFTDVDVVAHAAGFFGDGYETSAVVMSFVLFELAQNLEVQSKLRDEIAKNFEGDKFPYEVIQELPYLDAVISETLRVLPPLFSLSKLCTRPYTYTRENGTPLVIEKGTPIILPIYGLHMDPKYFEDPESFKPERFMGANREQIAKCTYIPFGEGPRACLGKRFGILQIKVGLVNLMKNYTLSVNKKTKLPLTYDPVNFIVTPHGGLWLDFKKVA